MRVKPTVRTRDIASHAPDRERLIGAMQHRVLKLPLLEENFVVALDNPQMTEMLAIALTSSFKG